MGRSGIDEFVGHLFGTGYVAVLDQRFDHVDGALRSGEFRRVLCQTAPQLVGFFVTVEAFECECPAEFHLIAVGVCGRCGKELSGGFDHVVVAVKVDACLHHAHACLAEHVGRRSAGCQITVAREGYLSFTLGQFAVGFYKHCFFSFVGVGIVADYAGGVGQRIVGIAGLGRILCQIKQRFGEIGSGCELADVGAQPVGIVVGEEAFLGIGECRGLEIGDLYFGSAGHRVDKHYIFRKLSVFGIYILEVVECHAGLLARRIGLHNFAVGLDGPGAVAAVHAVHGHHQRGAAGLSCGGVAFDHVVVDGKSVGAASGHGERFGLSHHGLGSESRRGIFRKHLFQKFQTRVVVTAESVHLGQLEQSVVA